MKHILIALVLSGVARADTSDGDGKQLVDAWLRAQNHGDFAAYQALYASRFTGIRRSGPRTVQLDRAGWLEDRGRMFKKPMVVEISELKIVGGAVVTFTQRWQSGSYRDVGPKQLVLAHEGGQARIAREEMLRSTRDRPPTSGAQLSFVIDDRWVVIDDAPDEAQATGAPWLADDTRATTALKRVKSAGDGWVGRSLKVWGKGAPCDTRVTAVQLMSRAYVHFGTVQAWKDEKPATVAREAWDLGGKLLVGALAPGCKDVGFARDASLPAPRLVQPTEPTAELRAAALRELRKLPRYKEIQKSWRDEKKSGRWEEQADDALVEVKAFGDWISVTATAGQGCGSWTGDIWALYEVTPTGLRLRNRPGSSVTITPDVAFDVDGDGVPELLYERAWWEPGTERGYVRPHPDRDDENLKLSSPFLDCPC